MVAPAQRKYSYTEYLALERESDVKHEFVNGEIFAMAGGSPGHAALAMRVGAALQRPGASGGCVVFSSDLKVFMSARQHSAYADATVVCGPLERAPQDRNAATNPTLLVEVLSDATEAYDRGEKFDSYATLPSLREYVLVDQYDRKVDVLRRNDTGSWTLLRFRDGDMVELPSVGARFSVEELYACLELEVRVRAPSGVVR